MRPEFSRERLTAIREARGLTMAEIGRRLGVSPTAVQSWETGKAAPTVLNVNELGQILGVSSRYFFQNDSPRGPVPGKDLIFFRSLADLPAKLKKQATRRVQWLQQIFSLIEEHVDFPDHKAWEEFDGTRIDYSKREIEVMAAQARRILGLNNESPILNLVDSIEKSGIVVAQMAIANTVDAFSYWPKEGRPYILLDSIKDSPGRLRFNAAHELGHMVLHRQVREKDLNRKLFREIERQADMFAASLLMPSETFAERVQYFGTRLEDLMDLKREWRGSMMAVVHRMKDLELIGSLEAQGLYKKMSRMGFRRSEPGDEYVPYEEPSFLPQAFDLLESSNKAFKEFIRIKMGLPDSDLDSLIGAKVFQKTERITQNRGPNVVDLF